jgi:hypothetical protein
MPPVSTVASTDMPGRTSAPSVFQPFRVDLLLRLVAGFDRLGCLSGTTLFRVPLRFRFVSLIQVYALHRNVGDSRGGSEIKLVPPKVD